jgi:hypothetical protein
MDSSSDEEERGADRSDEDAFQEYFGDSAEASYWVLLQYCRTRKLGEADFAALIDRVRSDIDLREMRGRPGTEAGRALSELLSDSTFLRMRAPWDCGIKILNVLTRGEKRSFFQNEAILDLRGSGSTSADMISRMLTSNTLLSKLDVEIYNRGLGTFGKSLSINTSMQKLRLRSNFSSVPFASEFVSGLKHNVGLTLLDLSHNKLGPDGARLIAGALAQNTSLRYLDVSENNIRSEGAQALAKMLETNSGLLGLNIVQNSIYDGFVAMGAALARNSSLQILQIEPGRSLQFRSALSYEKMNHLSRSDLQAIQQGLKSNSTLQTLHLGGQNWYERSEEWEDMSDYEYDHSLPLKSLICPTTGFSFLQHLSVASFPLQEEDGLALARALEADCSLRYLDINLSGSLSEASRLALCSSFGKNSSLIILEINYKADRDIYQAFGQILQQNTRLQYLHLTPEHTYRYDAPDIMPVFRALEKNTTLRKLKFYGSIQTNHLEPLTQSLRTNVSLEDFVLIPVIRYPKHSAEYLDPCNKNELDTLTHILFEIGKALRDIPRYRKLTLRGLPLRMAYFFCGMRADKNLAHRTTIFESPHGRHLSIFVAFVMGQHARLGGGSWVQRLNADCLKSVMVAYYKLPVDHFDIARVEDDYKQILKSVLDQEEFARY